MRALLERSRTARAAMVLSALAVVLALVQGAAARDDIGLRLDNLWFFNPPPAAQDAQVSDVPPAAPVVRRRARRIWAASRSRPLRIALDRRARRDRLARTRRARVSVARLRPAAERQAVLSKFITLPKPPRPAVVSIYEDRTLKNGDAVMMADGIHVFRGFGAWPHQPRDFVRLTFAAALDWRLRQSLDALDRNPPTRWTAIGSVSG